MDSRFRGNDWHFRYNGGFPPLLCCPSMIVLGVESSCDETGLALYDTEAGLLSHALHSQVAMHEEYGGVVPELASRDHIRRAIPLLQQTLDRAGKALSDIDAIGLYPGPRSGRCAAGGFLGGVQSGSGAGQAGAGRASPGRPPAVAAAGVAAAGISLHRPAGLGRPHPVDAGGRRRPVHPAGRNARRCRRRSLRQVGQAAGPRLPGRPGHFAPGRIRRPRKPTSCRARCCTRKISTSASRA